MDLFKEEKAKTYSSLGFKNQRKNLRELKQVGKTNVSRDKKRSALRAGKRISKTGKVYWETRKNRSDAPHSKV